MFGRRKRDADDVEETDLDLEELDEDELDDDEADDVDDDDLEDDVPGLSPRPHGPFDLDEVDEDDETVRLDLGALRLAGVDGMELRVDVDESSGTIVGVTAVLGESALQLQPYAAPRSEGIWDDVRLEIRRQINSQRGTLEEVPGEYGTELRTQVAAAMPDGTQVMQPARFVGIDGPRWLLRAVWLGRAATEPEQAGQLLDVLHGTVVVRGSEAMAPGDPLPLALPETAVVDDAPDDDVAPWEDGDLDPFERGPEITEIR